MQGSDLLFAQQSTDSATLTNDDEGDETKAEPAKRKAEDYQKLRDDVMMDFAAFEANIVRTQLLLNSNAKERERYMAEKLRIQEEAERVRNDTTDLRAQLEEAQQTLERRKGWDRLAEKITNNRMLRTREEQGANIEKLNAEIAQLEQESRDYASTWAERRQQFGRIVDEGMQMLRLIRDEKEEVERREGMEDKEDGDDGDAGLARERISHAGTPRPEGGATPLHPGTDAEAAGGLLRPRGRSSAQQSPAPDEAATPAKSAEDDDADMADEGELEEDDEQPEAERSEKDRMDTS